MGLNSKLKISRVLVSIFLIVQYNFFLLFKNNYIDEGISNFSMIITFILFALFFTNIFFEKKYTYKLVIFLMLVTIILSTSRSIYLYPLDLTTMLKNYVQWISVLIYFPLAIYIYNDKSFFLKILLIFNIIFIIIISYQVVVYNASGNLFVNKDYFIDPLTKLEKLNFRNGNLRITSSYMMITISLLISFVELIKKSRVNKYFNYINIILSLLYLNFVVQTRALTFLLIISILIYLIIIDIGFHSLSGYLFRALAILLIIGTLAYTKSYNLLFDTYNELSDVNNQVSTYARLGAYSYFKDIIFSNPIFGNGIFVGDIGSIAYYRSRGPAGIFYYDDLGIIGNMAQYGIFSLITTISYIYLGFVKESKKNYLFTIFFALSILTTLSWMHKLLIIPFIICLSYMYDKNDFNMERR
ncbi:hypothetical protein [Enterococcus sp. AZ102]|uniref:hypothetical protein n=1 Tax=Enterococcus sp. AZ102 TaxID=2774865 RepID=UPI003F22A431